MRFRKHGPLLYEAALFMLASFVPLLTMARQIRPFERKRIACLMSPLRGAELILRLVIVCRAALADGCWFVIALHDDGSIERAG